MRERDERQDRGEKKERKDWRYCCRGIICVYIYYIK